MRALMFAMLLLSGCKREAAGLGADDRPQSPPASAASASARPELAPLTAPAPTVGSVGSATELKPIGVGDTARATDYELTVKSVKECKVEAYFQPKPGSIKLGIQVGLAGISEHDVPVSPFHAQLESSDGTRYSSTLAGCRPILPSVRVAKGESAEGWISFELPKSASGLSLVYEPVIIGGARQTLRIALNR